MPTIYHFLIHRRTLVGLVVVCILVGSLLFFAGLLIGLHQGLQPELAQSPATPAGGSLALRSPVRPVTRTVRPTVRTPTASVRAPSATVTTQTPTLQQPTRLPSARVNARAPSTSVSARVPSTGSRSGSMSVPSTSSAGAASEETQAAQTEPTQVAETPSRTPSEPMTEAPAPTPVQTRPQPKPVAMPTMFSIQVGAYRETRYLEEAFKDLEDRGYHPYLVEVTGAGGQVFRTLRIGRYRTRDEAIRAAAEFQHREDMTALVRTVPLDMLPAEMPPSNPTLDSAGAPPRQAQLVPRAGM